MKLLVPPPSTTSDTDKTTTTDADLSGLITSFLAVRKGVVIRVVAVASVIVSYGKSL